MRNRMYGGVRGRKTKVGEKLLRFPPTRFVPQISQIPTDFLPYRSHADDADFFYFFTFLPLKVPQAVPSRKIWRGL